MDTQYPPDSTWREWPVSWSAVWVGALAALALGLIIGLVGFAVGAHEMSTRIVTWNTVRLVSVIFSIGGAFFAFVLGGWAAARVAGIRRSEPAMLHGAIAWLVAVPLLLALAGLGSGNAFGTWYGGLSGPPAWAQAPAPKAAVAPTDEGTRLSAEDAARA